jgi:uncharacterized protein (DUF2252 family)
LRHIREIVESCDTSTKEDDMTHEVEEQEQPNFTAGSDGTEPTTPAPKVLHFTPEERVARGRAARAEAPRTSHGALDLADDRDPVGLIDADRAQRVPDLVPIRYGRMLVSPFTFYRGAASIMAHDLAATPRSGLNVQLCGDAHLSNFGGFASPERDLVFDLNDFDETHVGPFEWDVKRLAASFEIAGRNREFSDAERQAAVLTVVRSYREAMRSFAEMRNLDLWYSRLDIGMLEAALKKQREKQAAKTVKRGAAKAQTKDSMKAFAKLTEVVDGERRIVSDPPLIVPVRDIATGDDERDATHEIRELIRTYRRSLQRDRRHLLEGFHYVDMARKVVGVGSVGTRCWIVLMLGRDGQDPLFLQCKEAGPSVLEAMLGKAKFNNHGQRVVEGQRLMQASSDIFLGWVHAKSGLDGQPRDFYVRQLWDWKTSADLELILPNGLVVYAQMCGWTLARAHARSGDRIAIASYLGRTDTFDRALAEFAVAYADLNERDYGLMLQAAREGRLPVQEGL